MPKKKNPNRIRGAKRARAKGGSFERYVAKWLSNWWGGLFRRSPKSGGWDPSKKFDLVPMDEIAAEFPGGVECKNQESFSFRMVLQSNDSPQLSNWWDQVSTNAINLNKMPMLFIKKNFFPPVLVLPFKLALTPYACAKVKSQYLYFYDLDTFGVRFKPKRFAELCKRNRKWNSVKKVKRKKVKKNVRKGK